MNLQRQQRRSSEVRGCLLRNFLDMRKRSLIRSESEDSGFSLESYEPFMSSSFDAEKFLQELGFAGDDTPLIPDRFIPSLIHRISNMPDETVMKLDNRVWNSIDSFKKKESTLWFFAQSSVECDLCINDLQRSYSLPAEFDPCDALLPINDHGMRNSSNSASRVQNWLSRFAGDSLTVGDKTKANIAYIGNQSSTESGILSAFSDDEAYTAASYTEGLGVNDWCCSRKWVDDSEFSVTKMDSLKPPAGMSFEERRPPETIPHSAPTDVVRVSTALCLETVPSSSRATSRIVSLTAPYTTVPKGERCLEESTDSENYFSALNRTDSAERYDRCKSIGENITESRTEFASSNRKLRQGDVKNVQISEQVRSVAENLDSDAESVCLSTENINHHYASSETGDSLQDLNVSIRRASTPKPPDVTSFDYIKKRHSFDSAYLTADEKRKRFRQSHSKTHHVLFSKNDSCYSASCLNETTSDDTTLHDFDTLRNSREETEVTQSDQLAPRKREYSIQDISHRNEGNLCTPSELPEMISNINISHHNKSNVDSPLELSGIVNCLDISHRNRGSLDTPSKVSDLVSNVDISHNNGSNIDSPLEVSGIVSNVDSPLEVSGIVSNVDSPVEVSNIVRNVDSPPELSDSVSNVDVSNHNGDSLNIPSEVHDVVNNVHMSRHNESSVDSPLQVSDIIRNVDISRSKDGNPDIPSEVSDIENHVKQSEAPTDSSRSGSESSEPYFSCDEFSTTQTLVDNDFTGHDGGEERKGIPTNLFPCVPTEQRVAPEKMTPQVRDKALFCNCNRSTYAKYKEHFILNKILKRNLKFSVLCPIEKMSRHFLLENDRADNEAFSQILNSNDTPPGSLKPSKVSEKHTKSVTSGKNASHDALLNFSTQKKPVGSIVGDKVRESDNSQSIISKPFVRNLSLTSDMCSPKCEVRLINYDGLALFWAARNAAEKSVSCSSGFPDSMNSISDNTINRRFINGIYMDVNSGNETDSTNNKVYFSEVRLEVNSEGSGRDPKKKRLERCVAAQKFQAEEDTKKEVQDNSITKAPTNTENPCGRALRDLEDLRTAIRKAKETRMSASRELKLLQELLHNGDSEGDDTAPRRTTLSLSESKLSLPNAEIITVNNGKGKTIEALSELQQKSANQASQNKEFWEEEIRKAKEEVSQVCHEKLSIMEEKLHTTEDELARALKENTRLKDQLEIRSSAFPVCKCNAEAQQHSDFSHMNGISDEDPKIISVAKPSAPTKNFWQEWDRLQSDLMKAERKADELNILLNRKLIELNRMQLTLSKQTKEMILLERAYFQLRSHLSKRKLNKSGSSHQSSSAAKTHSTEGASETSSKTTDPEIPP